MFSYSKKIILASASPRRVDILKNAGVCFTQLPATVEEPPFRGGQPYRYVRCLALAKARACAKRVSQGLVLAFDTSVFANGTFLNKPRNKKEAGTMLEKLSNSTHTVYTGIALIALPEREITVSHEKTTVFFGAISPEMIHQYIDSGEPFGKAGAYAIQGRAGAFISGIRGCYFNVVGLPLHKTIKILEKYRIKV